MCIYIETTCNATLSLPRGCVQVHSVNVQTAICLGGGPPLGEMK